MFAVLPILMVAGLFIWSGIAIVAVTLIVFALLIVVVDAWANRPIKKTSTPPRYREDY